MASSKTATQPISLSNGNHASATTLNGYGDSNHQGTPRQDESQDSSQPSTIFQRNQNQLFIDSLLSLYRDNQCSCTNASCKTDLSTQVKDFMKIDISKALINDFIHILSGATQNDKIFNMIIYFLKFLSIHTLPKDTMDDMLNLFVILYLKSPSPLKKVIIQDLETIFFLIKEQETLLIIDQTFKFKIFFLQLLQYKHCMTQSTQTQQQCEIITQGLSNKKRGILSKQQSMLHQNTNSDQKKEAKAKSCSMHGACDVRSQAIDLTSSKEKFISYMCFMAQFYFKILKIEDAQEDYKEIRRKYVCNILFSFLGNCQPKYYYYPLRALAEFYFEGESEKALSKRLNEESFLTYKMKKQFLGREQLLFEFSKANVGKSAQSEKSIQSGYNYLYADTISVLRSVLSQLEQSHHLDCFLLCLRILSRIINELKANEYLHNAISLYIDCLVAISQKLLRLSHSEQEIYYSEVKNLLTIIKEKQKEYEESRGSGDDDFEMENMESVSDNDFAKGVKSKHIFEKVNNRYVPMIIYKSLENSSGAQSRSKSQAPKGKQSSQYSKYPNLSVLQHLLTIQSAQQYPKLTQLIFDALLPYMEIFNNHLVSFTELCQQSSLIMKDFSNNENRELENMMKKIKLCEGASQGREVILNFFIRNYKKNLLNKVTEKGLQPNDYIPSTLMTVNEYVRHLLRIKSLLNKEELIFIIDFLINLCKHCQIYDTLAVSLGTHLLPEIYDITNKRINQIINTESHELIFINFYLRFKFFMPKFANYNRLLGIQSKMNLQNIVIQPPEDELFANLVAQVFKILTAPAQQPPMSIQSPVKETLANPQGKPMSVYTTYYFKIFIKLLQQNRNHIKIEQVKYIVDKVISVQKTDVMCNSWPLYIVISMFMNNYFQMDLSSNSDKEKSFYSILNDFFDTIMTQLKQFKEDQVTMKSPMLHFYRMRNLIYTFTLILKYLLCFRTPLSEKTSGSTDLYTGINNTQNPQQPSQQSQFTSSTQSFYGMINHSDDQHTSDTISKYEEMFESSFIVKRQKRCNFCGDLLSYPKKFTFQRKCRRCGLKNSNFIFPARFLCNCCIESNQSYLFRCNSDQIPTEAFKQADILSSESLLSKLQLILAKALSLALEDFNDPSSYDFYFNKDQSCIKKLTDPNRLYSQLVTYIMNRMLSIAQQMVVHDIEIEKQLVEGIKRVTERKEQLSEIFMITKQRIDDLNKCIRLHSRRMNRKVQ